LEDLSDGGIKECKSQIVTCIYWLLTNYPQKVNFLEPERQQAVFAVLNFMKKLYSFERSFSNDAITLDGKHNQEMFHAVSSVLICFALL